VPDRTPIDPMDICAARDCGAERAKTISDSIPLCWVHFAHAYAAWRNHVNRHDYAEPAEKPPHEKRVIVRRRETGNPVVYYISRPPHVKIGTTWNLHRRMKEMYVLPADLLAVEPGGRALEASRHQQFSSFRVRGTELFAANGVLTDLIEELAEKYPDPWRAADDIHLPPSEGDETMSLELFESRQKLGLLPAWSHRIT
jgi:hypothetical protein